MASKLRTIQSRVEERQVSVMDLLRVALEEEFEECVVVGLKGNDFKVMFTPTMTVLKVVGALEFAKADLIRVAE